VATIRPSVLPALPEVPLDTRRVRRVRVPAVPGANIRWRWPPPQKVLRQQAYGSDDESKDAEGEERRPDGPWGLASEDHHRDPGDHQQDTADQCALEGPVAKGPVPGAGAPG
jgi:hypothetical protein